MKLVAPEIESAIRDMCDDWAQSSYENDAERAEAVLAWLDSAETQALDAPDTQDYWAFEGYVGDNPNVMGRQDVVWVQSVELGIIVTTWGEHGETLRDYHGKWVRLTMPWGRKP